MLLFVVGTRPPQDGIRGTDGTIYFATSLWQSLGGQVVFANSSVPVPSRGGASVGFSSDRISSEWGRRFRLHAPIEFRAVDPDAMKDHRDPARQCDDSLLVPPASGDAHGPGFQR